MEEKKEENEEERERGREGGKEHLGRYLMNSCDTAVSVALIDTRK